MPVPPPRTSVRRDLSGPAPVPAAATGRSGPPVRRTLVPDGPFSLRESATFGFGQRDEPDFDGTMRLGFCLDGTYAPVGAALTQDPDGAVQVEVSGSGDEPVEVDAALRQVARVLSLDVDARPFVALGDRDPVLARLLAAAPGLRPPLFHSPYEALVWMVLSARRPARAMRAVRQRLGEEHGTVLEVAGRPFAVLPSPRQLLAVEQVPGLDAEKVLRLHGVARAALDGALDVGRLRALSQEEAERELQRLHGVGPFTATLVTVRALGHPDLLPADEPVGRAAVGQLYGLAAPPTVAQLAEIAEGWRPYRTWALVLARAASSRVLSRA